MPALEQEHGITAAQSGLIFGACIASFTVSMVFGGILQHKYGPRRIGMTGGVLFSAGYLTGSLSGGNVALMLTGFGLLAGIGIGFAYVCPLATGIKWYPKQKGRITGLAVAGFGLGSIFFARAGQRMIHDGLPVLDILQRTGWVVGVTVAACALLLFVPPPAEDCATAPQQQPLRAVLKDRRFRVLFWQMFCGTFGGLLLIGNLKPIGMTGGLSSESATQAVMLFAIGNASGRILWGLWYDRFGAGTITACMLMLAAGAAAMGLIATPAGFYPATLITAFAFGGCFVLFAARVADEFGAGHLSQIYPFIFLGYGIAGLAGPPAGGWMLARSGAPQLPCIAVILLALGGTLSSIRRNRAMRPVTQPIQQTERKTSWKTKTHSYPLLWAVNRIWALCRKLRLS